MISNSRTYSVVTRRCAASGARSVMAVGLLVGALSACSDNNTAPPPPSALTATSDIAPVGTVGETLSAPLTVRVVDAAGSPVDRAVVTFTVAEGGGVVTPAFDTTDAQGVASTSWRLGERTVAQRVTAAVAGVSGTVNFVATARAGAPSVIAVSAGDNQSAAAGAVLGTAPAVILRDRFTNPVPGVSVFFSVSAGGGTITGAGATTNAAGVATLGEWRLGSSVGANRLTALAVFNGVSGNPITFNATATAGTAATFTAVGGISLLGNVGTLVTPVPSVRVLDGNGNPVAGVQVVFAPSSGSNVVGGTKTTDAQGVASPDGWQLGTVAQNFTLTATAGSLTPIVFTATARGGAASQAAIFAGNAQTATVGRTLPVEPSVRVTDSFGNPIAGLEVVFDVLTGGGSAISRRPTTNANGVATVGAWTLGDEPGSNTLRATVTGTSIAGNPITFTATGTAGAPATVTIVTGNNQTAVAGSQLPTAPSVVVRDNRGNPVSGITVAFIAGAGAVINATSTTGTNGVATPGAWTLGGAAGTQSLIARVTGLPDVSFTATATAGTASSVVALTATSLGAFAVNSMVMPLPSVRVRDANGNPIAGATVVFTSEAGVNTLTGATKTTGADGIATLTSWQLGTIVGQYSVRALVNGVNLNGAEPLFSATAIAGPAASFAVAVNSVQTQPGVALNPVTTVPVVRLVDAFGNGVAGVVVTFTANNGSIAGITGVLTDVNGFASVGTWTMPLGSGARTLIATASGNGIAGNPITFTATVP